MCVCDCVYHDFQGLIFMFCWEILYCSNRAYFFIDSTITTIDLHIHFGVYQSLVILTFYIFHAFKNLTATKSYFQTFSTNFQQIIRLNLALLRHAYLAFPISLTKNGRALCQFNYRPCKQTFFHVRFSYLFFLLWLYMNILLLLFYQWGHIYTFVNLTYYDFFGLARKIVLRVEPLDFEVPKVILFTNLWAIFFFFKRWWSNREMHYHILLKLVMGQGRGMV